MRGMGPSRVGPYRVGACMAGAVGGVCVVGGRHA